MCVLGSLTSDKLRAFRDAHYTAENMVLAAAGVDHDDFVRLASKHLGKLPRGQGTTMSRRKASAYTGGEARLEQPLDDEFTRIAVAFEVRSKWRKGGEGGRGGGGGGRGGDRRDQGS